MSEKTCDKKNLFQNVVFSPSIHPSLSFCRMHVDVSASRVRRWSYDSYTVVIDNDLFYRLIPSDVSDAATVHVTRASRTDKTALVLFTAKSWSFSCFDSCVGEKSYWKSCPLIRFSRTFQCEKEFFTRIFWFALLYQQSTMISKQRHLLNATIDALLIISWKRMNNVWFFHQLI